MARVAIAPRRVQRDRPPRARDIQPAAKTIQRLNLPILARVISSSTYFQLSQS